MLLRLSAAIVRVSTKTSGPWRSLCTGKEFRSTLSDGKVTSPFQDPSRTRTVTGSIPLETLTTPSPKPIVEKTPVQQIFESKPFESTEQMKETTVLSSTPPASSAVDELDRLKGTLEKMESVKEEQKAGGSGGTGDDGHPKFDAQAEAEKRRIRMERNTRLGGLILLGGSVVGFFTFCFYYGRAERDAAGNVIQDEHTGSLLAPFYRIYNSIWQWRDFVLEPARTQLLPDPLPAPYLQPKYTLVIELKNILVSPEWTYKTGHRFVKRPALDYFLDVVGYPNFEVVIYTSESAMTAIPVIDSVDPKQRIMFRLYRDCTKYANGHHIKDLSKLNRDLSKVIFLEWDPKSAQLNPENMLRVPEWKGNMDDTSLVDLAELLKTIHLSDTDDVRPTIQYYSQFDDPAGEFRKRAMYLAQQEEEKKLAPDAADSSLLKRYSGRLFGFRRHQAV